MRLKRHGKDQIKNLSFAFLHQCIFALSDYRQKCDMKLVCLGKEEKNYWLARDWCGC